MANIISYYRVSTIKQEESGLGLAAQRHTIENFQGSNGHNLIAEYQDVESGRKCDRPNMLLALDHARRTGATLVIAKLDRLARNVAFISTLMEAGVEFIACDMPFANRFTLHIFAALAEEEARMIRERTKAALAVRKAKGMKLGAANPKIAAALEGKRGWQKGSENSRRSRARMLSERYSHLLPVIRALRDRGDSFETIAASLNKQGYTTLRKQPFCRHQVARVLKMELAACPPATTSP